ncbi:ATP-dependent nuclease [Priestia megaterium]|uniref:ATP-dependent nuclease n=1 Tax=Priestia megaterium TaxID=1404 RepID=UPI000BF65269|nr:AAA family ATPase [Priestia megaterium]PFT49483.1 ATP-dependent endonuclease [Priestia megaterium]
MFLKELKIWNFRKYGAKGNNDVEPGITIPFHKNFNLLIGENDSGKTAIIDAIRLTIGTSSSDNSRIKDEDFHINYQGHVSESLKIECVFSDLSEEEAGLLVEWLSFDSNNEYELVVRMKANKINNKISKGRIEKIVTAGPEYAENRLEGFAQDLIKTTYLKPLRDAENELKPGSRSRLAQILKSHSTFKESSIDDEHELVKIVNEINEEIRKYFDKPFKDDRTIKNEIQGYLEHFFHIPTKGDELYNPNFQVAPARLFDILRKLSLELDDKVSGLGSLNLLFIATELILHNDTQDLGSRLTLIEEIEAHLHPQAQLRLIKYLQSKLEDNETNNSSQFILTTHSTNLTASTDLEHIILINENIAYPMGELYTNLDSYDYKFLQRFLDSTKANLFFARGIIFVEGDAENLLLPIIAEVIDRPLHRYGISIVNIGNTAFQRYAKIFSRSKSWLEQGLPELKIPVSIVTDVDVRPLQYYSDKDEIKELYIIKDKNDIENICSLYKNIKEEDLFPLIGSTFSSFKSFKKELEGYVEDFEGEEDLYEDFKVNISQEIIDLLRHSKKESIERKYNDLGSNIEVFVAPHWTLEYELALSSIDKYLAQVIHSVRYKKPNSTANERKLQTLIEKINLKENIEDVAYEIYKPLNDKLVSKAIVAQELAQVIQSNKTELRNIILSDPYLDYLKKSIYHVTEGVAHD